MVITVEVSRQAGVWSNGSFLMSVRDVINTDAMQIGDLTIRKKAVNIFLFSQFSKYFNLRINLFMIVQNQKTMLTKYC